MMPFHNGALADVPSMPHPHLRNNNERQNMRKQTYITNEQLTHVFAHVYLDPLKAKESHMTKL